MFIYKRLNIEMKSLSWADKIHQQKVLQALDEGKILVGDSDTVLGLLAKPSQQAVLRLDALKRRVDQPYILLTDSVEKIGQVCDLEAVAQLQCVMTHCWPGPLTLILPAKKDAPSYLASKNGAIAVRIPHHPGLLAVLQHFPGLLSTSANLSGDPVPLRPSEIDHTLVAGAAHLILNEQDDRECTPVPSTILDCTGPQVVVVREGAYKIADLEKVCTCRG